MNIHLIIKRKDGNLISRLSHTHVLLVSAARTGSDFCEAIFYTPFLLSKKLNENPQGLL